MTSGAQTVHRNSKIYRVSESASFFRLLGFLRVFKVKSILLGLAPRAVGERPRLPLLVHLSPPVQACVSVLLSVALTVLIHPE